MNDYEARSIAAELARTIDLPPRAGSVFIVRPSDAEYRLLVAVDPRWLKSHPGLPKSFKGLDVDTDDRITGLAHGMLA